MKKKFSNSWNSSKQVRKQRKYRYNAPLHVKHKFLSSHLSKELMKKYGTRNIPVKKGDTVKVAVGQFKNHTGKVQKELLSKSKVHIEGVELIKKDGTRVYYPVHASNLIITILDLADKKRQKILQRSSNEQKTS